MKQNRIPMLLGIFIIIIGWNLVGVFLAILLGLFGVAEKVLPAFRTLYFAAIGFSVLYYLSERIKEDKRIEAEQAAAENQNSESPDS